MAKKFLPTDVRSTMIKAAAALIEEHQEHRALDLYQATGGSAVHGEAMRKTAVSFLRQGDYNTAMRWYKALGEKPSPEAARRSVRLMLRRGDYQFGIPACKEIGYKPSRALLIACGDANNHTPERLWLYTKAKARGRLLAIGRGWRQDRHSFDGNFTWALQEANVRSELIAYAKHLAKAGSLEWNEAMDCFVQVKRYDCALEVLGMATKSQHDADHVVHGLTLLLKSTVPEDVRSKAREIGKLYAAGLLEIYSHGSLSAYKKVLRALHGRFKRATAEAYGFRCLEEGSLDVALATFEEHKHTEGLQACMLAYGKRDDHFKVSQVWEKLEAIA